MREALRDMVIILPGITGSVLQHRGRDLWAPSIQAVWRAAATFGADLQYLRLAADDADVEHVDDIRATRLIKGPHIIPGLVKIDGYMSLAGLLKEHFDVLEGAVDSRAPANYYEFPYDWRRDNRVAARALQRLVERQLPIWREHTGAADAKAILLAHSMGGLVARYFVEVLGGWEHCRALVTFGTPYAGSVNSLNFLANGYRKRFVDLTDVMRSLTSSYQLLPTYEVIVSPGIGGRRVADVDKVTGVDAARARAALDFHREIGQAVGMNRENPAYLKGFKTLPFVGARQWTFQSAWLQDGALIPDYLTPPGVHETLQGGDGTVPRVSAIPQELWAEFSASYVVEQHSAIQCNADVLTDLLERLRQMQAPGLRAVRGASLPRPRRAALALRIDDLVPQGEPLQIQCDLLDATSNEDFGGIEVEVVRVDETNDADAPSLTARLERVSDTEWAAEVPELPTGTYRAIVRTRRTTPSAPTPVQDLVLVADESAPGA
jgi:pimeloyl-ACP methyl ester carboxylesterase